LNPPSPVDFFEAKRESRSFVSDFSTAKRESRPRRWDFCEAKRETHHGGGTFAEQSGEVFPKTGRRAAKPDGAAGASYIAREAAAVSEKTQKRRG
jgi:hypothetical protein